MTTYAPDHRSAVELTSQARAAADLAATQYRLGRFLPSVDNYSLTYQFDVNQIGLVDKAEYRAFDTETQYGRTQGGSSRAGSLPPIGRKYRVGEYAQLQLVAQNDLIGNKLDEYARRAGAAIAARVALAQGEALQKGQVTLRENKLEATIDYGRKPEHSQTASTVYTDPTADVITDVENWTAIYRLVNGSNPGTALISQRILTALAKNTGIIREVVQRGTDLPSRVSYDDVRSVLASYNVSGVEVYDQAIDGERIIDDDVILFLPSDGGVVLDGGVLGTTEWGITAESIQPGYGITDTERPGIFAAAFTDTDPQGTDVLGSAVVIPAVKNANATLVATVLAPAV
jgi:hypothetical protein